MNALKMQLRIEQGETLLLHLELQNPDETPEDLTGHTFVLTVRWLGNAIATPQVEGDDTGVIELRVTDEDTAAWNLGGHTYRVDRLQPNGDRFTILKGPLEVENA